MTAPGRYAASDGSFAKSAGGAAARGGVLIAIAVVIGVFLLKQGFDGGDPAASVPDDSSTVDNDSSAGADDASGTSGDDASIVVDDVPVDDGSAGAIDDSGTSGDDASLVDDVAVDPPSSVQVAVLNGSGVPGLAGDRAGALGIAGYTAVGANAGSLDQELSRIYYLPGYEDEAKAVAVVLNAPSSVLDQSPADPLELVAEGDRENVTDFDIYVVLGADGELG